MSRPRLLMAAAVGGVLLAIGAPASAYWLLTAEGQTTVSTTRLAAPTVNLSTTGTEVTVMVGHAATGDAPTRYAVAYAGPLGEGIACPAMTTPGSCVHRVGVAAAQRTYTVSAGIGQWAGTVTATGYTAPPKPDLRLADQPGDLPAGSTRQAAPDLMLTAAPGESTYTVQMMLDGELLGAPVSISPTAPGSQRWTAPHGLTPGGHTFVAVARFHGLAVTSTALAVQVVSSVATVVKPATPATADPPLVTTSPSPSPSASPNPSPAALGLAGEASPSPAP